jgi:E3 ubiquitin-protein ligase RNF115/126
MLSTRFLRSAPPSSNNGDNRDNPQISGPLFAQYLISLLGQTDHPLLPMVGGMPESGRMGDYVFSQEGEFTAFE